MMTIYTFLGENYPFKEKNSQISKVFLYIQE